MLGNKQDNDTWLGRQGCRFNAYVARANAWGSGMARNVWPKTQTEQSSRYRIRPALPTF